MGSLDKEITGVVPEQRHIRLTTDQVLEVWKHFANTGGADKERMVTITTWLLAFSVAAISYIATKLVNYKTAPVKINNPELAVVIVVLGLVVSLVGLFVVLLYAGYSNRYWAKADKLAYDHKIKELYPETETVQEFCCEATGLNRLVLPIIYALARNRDPRRSLAPIFWVFIILSAGLLVVNVFLLLFIINALLIPNSS